MCPRRSLRVVSLYDHVYVRAYASPLGKQKSSFHFRVIGMLGPKPDPFILFR